MYTVDDDFTHVNNIVYKYLCINGLYTSESWKGGAEFSQKEWKKSLQFVSFAYSVSFLDPESSFERRPAVYFPGSPGSETGLWSPNIPELLGTSGREACLPEGNLGGCCCSRESALLLCVCLCSVCVAAKFPSGRVSVWRRTGEVSLELFWAFSGPGLWGKTVGVMSHLAETLQTDRWEETDDTQTPYKCVFGQKQLTHSWHSLIGTGNIYSFNMAQFSQLAAEYRLKFEYLLGSRRSLNHWRCLYKHVFLLQ